MKTRVAKWGNSLGVRVPAGLAAEIGLAAGTELQIVREGRALRLIPSRNRRYSLKELLASVRPENLHGETRSGSAVGAEILE